MNNTKIGWKKKAILFFISQCITLFGSQIVSMAIIWHVTLQTNSGVWVAAFSLCSYLPQFFVSFVGGVWADRYNKKRLIIGADLLIALVTLIMLFAMPYIGTGDSLLFVLLAMSAVRSAGAGIQGPAVNAVIPGLVPEDSLMRYNGINATMQSVVQFAAPAVSAVILTAGNLRLTLAADVLTAIFGIGILFCLALHDNKTGAVSESVILDLRIGTDYAWRNKTVRKMLIIYAAFTFLTVPAGYLNGLLVSRVFGDTYWYLTAAELVGFGGMMAGGLVVSAWGGFRSHSMTLAAGLWAFGLMAIGMSICHNFLLYLILMSLYGVALTVVQTTITTVLQQSCKPQLHGRIFGLLNSLYAGFYPAGMAIFGPMADHIPLQTMMVLSGFALMAVGFYSFVGINKK